MSVNNHIDCDCGFIYEPNPEPIDGKNSLIWTCQVCANMTHFITNGGAAVSQVDNFLGGNFY